LIFFQTTKRKLTIEATSDQIEEQLAEEGVDLKKVDEIIPLLKALESMISKYRFIDDDILKESKLKRTKERKLNQYFKLLMNREFDDKKSSFSPFYKSSIQDQQLNEIIQHVG